MKKNIYLAIAIVLLIQLQAFSEGYEKSVTMGVDGNTGENVTEYTYTPETPSQEELKYQAPTVIEHPTYNYYNPYPYYTPFYNNYYRPFPYSGGGQIVFTYSSTGIKHGPDGRVIRPGHEYQPPKPPPPPKQQNNGPAGKPGNNPNQPPGMKH